MNAIDAISDPIEAFFDEPLYVDLRPFIVLALGIALYTISREMPAIQRYLNVKGMARDHKPTR